MSASAEFVGYVLELLESFVTSGSNIYSKPFFGGKALRYENSKQNSIQFAMIMGDIFYLCVDDTTRPEFEALDMEPFSYHTKKGRVRVKKYYSVPADWLEDAEILQGHVMKAIESARNTRPRKKNNVKAKNTSTRLHADFRWLHVVIKPTLATCSAYSYAVE